MKIQSFRELKVYKKLFRLHLEVDAISHQFPKHELYELGSQIRRSSNSAPANVAEGWNNKHTSIYLETLNRAVAESQETQHHLSVARAKGYINQEQFIEIDSRYLECIKMMYGLKKALSTKK